MSRIWKKIRDRWMISILIIIVFLAAVTFSNYRANRECAERLAQIMDTVNTYLATATEDEYEEIAETIRHDLVYSQYNEDIENLIQYIPNTADGCCLERDGYLSWANLVFLNTGELYGLDVFETGDLPEPEEEGYSVQLTCGYDEISEASIHITKEREAL